MADLSKDQKPTQVEGATPEVVRVEKVEVVANDTPAPEVVEEVEEVIEPRFSAVDFLDSRPLSQGDYAFMLGVLLHHGNFPRPLAEWEQLCARLF